MLVSGSICNHAQQQQGAIYTGARCLDCNSCTSMYPGLLVIRDSSCMLCTCHIYVLALAQELAKQSSPRYRILFRYKLIAQLRQVEAMRSACFSAQRTPFKAHASARVQCTPRCTASAVARDAACSRREALKVRDSGGSARKIDWITPLFNGLRRSSPYKPPCARVCAPWLAGCCVSRLTCGG